MQPDVNGDFSMTLPIVTDKNDFHAILAEALNRDRIIHTVISLTLKRLPQ